MASTSEAEGASNWSNTFALLLEAPDDEVGALYAGALVGAAPVFDLFAPFCEDSAMKAINPPMPTSHPQAVPRPCFPTGGLYGAAGRASGAFVGTDADVGVGEGAGWGLARAGAGGGEGAAGMSTFDTSFDSPANPLFPGLPCSSAEFTAMPPDFLYEAASVNPFGAFLELRLWYGHM